MTKMKLDPCPWLESGLKPGYYLAGWRSLALELLLQLVVVTMPFNKSGSGQTRGEQTLLVDSKEKP